MSDEKKMSGLEEFITGEIPPPDPEPLTKEMLEKAIRALWEYQRPVEPFPPPHLAQTWYKMFPPEDTDE